MRCCLKAKSAAKSPAGRRARDGDLALIRYTQYIDEHAADPDAEALDAAVVEMVRGWAPAVEAELITAAGVSRATRLALTYINSFPDGYRSRTAPEEGAADILHLCQLNNDSDRGVRITRHDIECARSDTAEDLSPRRADSVVRRSSGVRKLRFRVLEEMPTALGGRAGYIHDFLVEIASEADLDGLEARLAEIEAAITSVLCGIAENDEFNQLVLYAGLATRHVVWIRAWFRYLRQTGSSFGLITVVEALRRAARCHAGPRRPLRCSP